MSQFQDVLANIIKGKRKENELYNRIFVVSAYNNVTNWLLEHKKTGAPGIYVKFVEDGDYSAALDELCDKLIQLNRGFADIKLDQEVADKFIKDRIQQAKNYLYSMHNVAGSGYVNKANIFLAAREILSSIGEAHSAFNSVNICQNNGINATFVDLCGFNDSESLTIDERIKKEFSGIDFSKTLCIATGYTKGIEGIMRAFDRGYSEVTFSKIAVEVKADEAIIHKEFHLSSADPKLVGTENSIVVGNTNFMVADQLADVGMEAIHPKAAKPLELAGINIRIKNTFEPEHPGTLISKNYISKETKVEIVSGTDKVLAIEVHDPMMVGEVGYDLKGMKHHKLSRYTSVADFINPAVKVKYDMSPKEFLANVNGAQMVVSASFHCICFSIILNKPFVCFLTGNDGKDERLKTLLTHFGLMDRVYRNDMTLEDVQKPIDWVKVNAVMQEKRKDSVEFLLNSL